MSTSGAGNETRETHCNDCIERCDQVNFPCVCHITPMQDRLDRIETTLMEIHDMMVKTDKAVATIVEQVKPALDDLAKSPILKMLGMKK